MKTLKDFESGYVETQWMSGESIDGFSAVNIEELKQEAIKLVKTEDSNHLKTISTIDWLNFFEISEEDLK